jgi:hypothetical protein
MNTSDFINNAEYLIRQCLNQTQTDRVMKACLQDACLELAKARQKDIRKTDYNSFDDKEIEMTTFDFGDGNGPVPAHKHPNGGGWVADTATVDETAYVGGAEARVYGNAQVSGNAKVSGNAWVFGNAKVYGNAQVYDNAGVSGDAQVFHDAGVFGNAEVFDNAWVFGKARVLGDAQVYDNARVSGDAKVSGDARVSGDGTDEDIFIEMNGKRYKLVEVE